MKYKHSSVRPHILGARTILLAHLAGNIALLTHPHRSPKTSTRVRSLPLNELSRHLAHSNELRRHLTHYLSEVQKYLDVQEQRSVVVRQIASYLGYPSWKFSPKPMLAAKTVEKNIREGYPSEVNALFFEKYFLQSPTPLGRPRTVTEGPIALHALELHELDPKRTWHSIADEVYACKNHTHDNAHPCTEKLKQAVARLRKFLRALQSSREATTST